MYRRRSPSLDSPPRRHNSPPGRYRSPSPGYSPPRQRSDSRGQRRGGRSNSRQQNRRRPRYSPSRSRSRSRGRGGGGGGRKGGGGGGGGGGNFACFDWLRKECKLGDRCPKPHPDKEECRRIKDILAGQPCKKGAQCPRPDCLYKHPNDHERRRNQRRSPSDSRSRSPSPVVIMMRAVGLKSYGDVAVLNEMKVPKPSVDPRSKDVLVRVRASDMNVLDLKMREGMLSRDLSSSGYRVLGYSGAGLVEDMSIEAGACGRFKKGDGVWFANSWDPARGSNQEFVLVDYRSVALKPKILPDEDAAAVPAVALTAWSALFDRMNMDLHLFHTGVKTVRFSPENKGVFLALPGSSAAGSFALQLASKHLNKNNNLTVVATASTSEAETWCLRMGADHVFDHNAPSFKDELNKLKIKGVDYVFYSTASREHEPKVYEVMNTMGQIVFHDDASFLLMKDPFPKQISIHRSRTEARTTFESDGTTLTKVAQLFDDPTVGLQAMVTKRFPELTKENVRQAHTWQSNNGDDVIGKAVINID